MSLVLITDSSGTPKDWANFEEAACYYTRNKVIWEYGTTIKEFYGGISRTSGKQSKLTVSSILGVSGPLIGEEFTHKQTIFADRAILYARDRYICAYCGTKFEGKLLTIDHVMPKSRGGKNTWVYCVS